MNDLLERFDSLSSKELEDLVNLSANNSLKQADSSINQTSYQLICNLMNSFTLNEKKDKGIKQRKAIYSVCLNFTDDSEEFALYLAGHKKILLNMVDFLKKCSHCEKDPNFMIPYLTVAILYNMSKYEKDEIKDALVYSNIHNYHCDLSESFSKPAQRILPLLLLLKINISLNKYPLYAEPVIIYFDEAISHLNESNDFIYEGLEVNEIYTGLKKLLMNNSFSEEYLYRNIVKSSIDLLKLLPTNREDSIKLIQEYLKLITVNDECRQVALAELRLSADVNANLIREYLGIEPKLERKKEQEKFDIMLSYTHRDREVVDRVAQDLLAKDFKIWKDDQQIHGSDDLLDSISTAVENSEVILIFFSSEYQKSIHTKAGESTENFYFYLTEAQYAYKLKKNIIYIRVERNFNPTGWLGIMLSTRIYIDFSGKYPYEEKIKDLLWTLENKSPLGTTNDGDGEKIKEQIESVYKPTCKLIFQKGISLQNWRVEKLFEEFSSCKIRYLTEAQAKLICRLRFTDKTAYLNYVVNNLGADEAYEVIKMITHLAGTITSESEDYKKFEEH